jgi:hypothetical protein
LPHTFRKALGSGSNTSFIFLVIVISAIATAAMIREIFINTLAALTKYAVPIRSQPGEIAFEYLIRVFRVYKFNPFSSEVSGEL